MIGKHSHNYETTILIRPTLLHFLPQSQITERLFSRTSRLFLEGLNSPMNGKFDSNASMYRSWKDAKATYIHTLMNQLHNPIFLGVRLGIKVLKIDHYYQMHSYYPPFWCSISTWDRGTSYLSSTQSFSFESRKRPGARK